MNCLAVYAELMLTLAIRQYHERTAWKRRATSCPAG
jgi:hypothetical protein